MTTPTTATPAERRVEDLAARLADLNAQRGRLLHLSSETRAQLSTLRAERRRRLLADGNAAALGEMDAEISRHERDLEDFEATIAEVETELTSIEREHGAALLRVAQLAEARLLLDYHKVIAELYAGLERLAERAREARRLMTERNNLNASTTAKLPGGKAQLAGEESVVSHVIRSAEQASTLVGQNEAQIARLQARIRDLEDAA